MFFSASDSPQLWVRIMCSGWKGDWKATRAAASSLQPLTGLSLSLSLKDGSASAYDDWTRSYTTYSSWHCLSRGFGLHDLQRSLLTSMILWFCLLIEARHEGPPWVSASCATSRADGEGGASRSRIALDIRGKRTVHYRGSRRWSLLGGPLDCSIAWKAPF